MYRKFIKRIMDIIISFFALVFLMPVFILISILLIYSNKGSVFFFQNRPGKEERIFQVIKFKTMNDKRDQLGELLPDADRLTNLGVFIRKTSLDELPQLINVLKGDMSLIGPRPLLPSYISLYNEEQKKRHLVRPGITGWAQVNGRNTITWKEKFNLDIWYVDHLNFWLDIKIIFKTIIKVFKSEGINAIGQTTTTPFTGNNDE